MNMVFMSRRFQFYVFFKIQELGCISAGLGYNGMKEGKHQWDRVVGGFCLAMETSYDPLELLKVTIICSVNKFNSAGT